MEVKPFIPYQHLEKFGTDEVSFIELGECFVFPKIDGTNASVWLSNNEIQAGSRTRHLSLDKDNAGFFAWAKEQQNLLDYLRKNPTHRLFGEWLVPHSLKTYKNDSWKRFYVFDVAVDRTKEEITHPNDSKLNYVHYDIYKPLLEEFGIDYIPPICKITNGSLGQFIHQLNNNVFLIEDGKGVGEGIVIKRYDFRNKFNRTVWAKIVTTEFKEKHSKTLGPPELKGEKMVELEIAEEFITKTLVDKEYAKIAVEGWQSKKIPQLLNTVYYTLIKEESWEFLKKHKNPTIDFKRLQQFSFNRIKSLKPELF